MWHLPFLMVVATCFCYEKVRRTMRAAIVSNLFNEMNLQLHKEMKLVTTYYLASTGNFNGSTQCSKAGRLLGKSNVSEQRVYWLRSKISTYRRDLERDLPNFNPILCNYGKPWRFSRTLRSW